MMFDLPPGAFSKIDKWLKEEVYPPIVARQKQDPSIAAAFIMVTEDGTEVPYSGAIGGALTYSFTPTGLGTIVVVQYGDKTLDLTDYETW